MRRSRIGQTRSTFWVWWLYSEAIPVRGRVDRQGGRVAPAEATYHASLAEVYWALGMPDRTVASCREALRLQPGNTEVLCNLGSTLDAQGKIDEAIGCFREAIRLAPNLAIAHNNLANALRKNGEKAAAIAEFREAVRLDPAMAEARSNLGRMLLDQGAPGEALVHCEEAVRLRPGFAPACLNLANVLDVLGRLDEAKRWLHEAIRLKPDMAAAHASFGGVLEQSGDMQQAVAALREALRHDPRHAGALARLATSMRGELADSDRAMIESLLADPALAPSGAGRWSLGWRKCWTHERSSSDLPGYLSRPMRYRQPILGNGAWVMTRKPTTGSSSSLSGRSRPSFSREHAVLARNLHGRCLWWACRDPARR